MQQLVALALPGGTRFVDELRRAWAAGDAVFPIDLRLPEEMRRRLVSSVRAARLVDETGSYPLSASRPTEPGDALVIATSGTAGRPKAAVLTHAALAASARITSEALNVSRDDHWLACLPLSHIGGLSVVTRALLTDTSVTVVPSFEPDVVTSAAKNGATLVSLVTAAMRRIDTTLFRQILLGGGPAPADMPSNAIATYGMTETASGVVYNGYPLRDVELRTDNDDIVWVRSPTLLRCYRDGSRPLDDQPLDEKGWFSTRDMGAIADDGKLTIYGRKDELIITGGQKVWPQVVEDVILRHRSVRAVLVHGTEDADWGQRVVATIEMSGVDRPSLDDIRALVKEHLPAYCAPREMRITQALARTSNGKIRRNTSAAVTEQ